MLSIYLYVQTPLNLVNVLERALQVLSRSQPHVRAAKQTAPGPASHTEAEGLLSSTLLMILAVRLIEPSVLSPREIAFLCSHCLLWQMDYDCTPCQ